MKRLLVVLCGVGFFAVAPAGLAQQYVQGYVRSDGTYVQGHYQSSPNRTVQDNYGYSGNVNPYTGATGSDRYSHSQSSPYYEGPRNSYNTQPRTRSTYSTQPRTRNTYTTQPYSTCCSR